MENSEFQLIRRETVAWNLRKIFERWSEGNDEEKQVVL